MPKFSLHFIFNKIPSSAENVRAWTIPAGEAPVLSTPKPQACAARNIVLWATGGRVNKTGQAGHSPG